MMSYEMFSSVLSLLTYAQYDRTRKEKNQNSNTHCCNYCDRNSRWYIFETRHCRTKYYEFQRIYNGKYGAEVKEESKFQSPSIRFLPTPIDTCLTRDPDPKSLSGKKITNFKIQKLRFFVFWSFRFFEHTKLRNHENTGSRYLINMEKKDEISRPIPTNVPIGIPRLLLSGLN